MSAAILLACYRNSAEPPHDQLDRIEKAFPAAVRRMTRAKLRGEGLIGAVWSHQASRAFGVATDGSGSSLALLGNPSRLDLAGSKGDKLLRTVLAELTRSGIDAVASLSPPFAAVFYDSKDAVTHVAVDRAGIQHLYIAEDRGCTWIASSSLALGSGVGSELDISGLGEFLSAGHFVSQRTFFRQVRKLDCGERVAIRDGIQEQRTVWVPERHGPPSDPVEAYVRNIKRAVSASAGSRPGLSAELTGGLDSRIVLASLLSNESTFMAWTIAAADSDEARTISRLRKKVPFDHMLIEPPPMLARRLPSLTTEMHALHDGEVNALEYAPLLVAFEDLKGLREVSLSGVPGELFRGFYYRVLKAKGSPVIRGLSVAALFNSLARATQHHGGLRREIFPDPTRPLMEPVSSFVESSPFMDVTGIAEDFYLRVRMQRFAGRQHTTTGYFCMQGLPYFNDDVVDLSFSVPTELKKHDGYLPRVALMRLSPALASVPLASGAFVKPAEWKSPGALAVANLALARKGLSRYGGRVGRTIAAPRADSMSWKSIASDRGFGDFIRDLLIARDTRLAEYVERSHIEGCVQRFLDGGPAYAAGILVTAELTLRRVSA